MRKVADIAIIISCLLLSAFSLFLGIYSFLVAFSKIEYNPLFWKDSLIINIWLYANAISGIVISLLWIVMVLNCIYYLTSRAEEKLVYTKWLILLIFFNFVMGPFYYFIKFKKHKRVFHRE